MNPHEQLWWSLHPEADIRNLIGYDPNARRRAYQRYIDNARIYVAPVKSPERPAPPPPTTPAQKIWPHLPRR